ncbi:MAG: hypothetical protein EON59_00375 [Alphaproteobacteria bacterium]|nr:MAG: hypothetical protein EON59_00375 [Alphaproteobacteria bacterium]
MRPLGVPAASAAVILLRDELAAGTMRPIETLALAGLEIDVRAGRDSLWALIRRAGAGGMALRLAFAPGGCGEVRKRRAGPGEALRLEMHSAIGTHHVALCLHEDATPVLRVMTSLVPRVPLLVQFLPRDIYPLDAKGDPANAKGEVEAAQRGMNSGLLYFRMEGFGSTLYVQNLTTLNPYFRATDTKPDGVVGGEWPELGYLPPTPPEKGLPSIDPLPAGEETVLSDAFIAFNEHADADEQAMARRYLDLLGAVYRRIEHPALEYHDWVERAGRTMRDLAISPKATIRHYGHRYIRPYTASEYPDSMVQLSLLASIRDYEMWSREKVAIGAELAAGLGKFYDSKLKTMRRYLPNVGKDKDKDAVDSWYLYHPMLNLGRLASDGDAQAKRLFLKSIDFGIKAAHHFDYHWPIQYKVTDFSVIVEARNDDGLGQTDVGGIYAYVMLLAFELTDDKRFLDEARAAIDAAAGMRFELNYQANLTAWGASACMRLWRITNDENYLRHSYVYLASFFHNTAIWESEIAHAAKYRNFLGVTALHDAPYMALYECFDSFAAFERLLKDSGPDLDPAARMLISEYCCYALDRAWYYFPDALPEDAIAKENRNGHIDRNLSFPVEDLYVDGQEAGQVGQEIYGAGAPFIFSSRAFHTVSGAPFRIFCDHFLLASERPTEHAISFQLGGGEGCEAMLCLIRTGRAKLPAFTVTSMAGDRIRPRATAADRIEYYVPANGRITVQWQGT